WRFVSHDVDSEAARPSPFTAGQRPRPNETRLRGRDVAAVRGLRTRLRDGGDRSGVLRARHSSAPRREDERHRLLVEDDRVLHAPVAWLQLRAWTDAVGR